MIWRTQATVNLSAIAHNLQVVRDLVGQRYIMAMIKANGYGHGILPVAKAIDSVSGFGVATIDEACQLKEAKIKSPIVLMSGFTDREELQFLVEHEIATIVHHENQINLLEKATFPKPFNIWLKVDTGMHRLGILPQQFNELFSRLNKIRHIKKPFGLMTHLADADNDDRKFTLEQFSLFEKLFANKPGLKSIGNSAAILRYTEKLCDMVRPGIMLYGVSPFADKVGADFNLKPAMTLSSQIIAIKQLKRGDKVGYGCIWECPDDMLIAIIAIGYGDGYPRHAENGTPVLVNDVRCPLVGRVSMDMIIVDLRLQPNAKIGDQVILWGDDLPVETIAACANTIGYELSCNITPRVKFVYT